MKKILITMLVAIIATSQMGAKPVTHHGKVNAVKSTAASTTTTAKETTPESKSTTQVSVTDSVIKVIDEAGNKAIIKYGDLQKLVKDHLDDTVLSSAGIVVESADVDIAPNDTDVVVEDANYEKVLNQQQVDLANRGMDLARDITRYFAWALVAIVLLALLFYYLHRRRKYKTIDNAIMNNYPLPNEFFGKRSMPQQPTTVYVNQVLPSPAANAADGSQPAPAAPAASSNPLKNITDWTPFKSGIRTTAWGLGLLLFFWILGAKPIAALMLIVIFIGCGKLFTTYQEQQSIKNYWQNKNWTQQTQQPPMPAPPVQQPPVFNQDNAMPPMPETPPEFNSEVGD